MLRRVQGYALIVFGDVIEHDRLSDSASAVGEAQLDIRIAQGLELFRKSRNRLSALWRSFRRSNRRRRRREDRWGRRCRSLTGRGSNRSRSRRHLLGQIHFPYDEPDYTKSDYNPRCSIHKFAFARSDAATDLILRSARPARRHRVVPTSTPWLAASEALQSQPASVPNAMRLHRFQKISRTGRGTSAAAVRTAKQSEERRKRALIEANDKTDQSEHQSRIEARLARRNHSSSNKL